MQIVLISWRTLGASELLLLPSPFSRLGVFFSPCVVCFLGVIVVVFEVLGPPPTLRLSPSQLISSPTPNAAIPLPPSLRPSGLVAGFQSSFMAALMTWPNPRRTNQWKGG